MNAAASPHPQLHGYLLDPDLPLAEDVRSLPRILLQVSKKAVELASRVPDFPRRLQQMRKRHGVDGANDSPVPFAR